MDSEKGEFPPVPSAGVDLVRSVRENEEEPPLIDTLCMFRASPLAWEDHDRQYYPLARLDLESEKKGVLEGLQDAKDRCGAEIRVVMEIATIDRLSAFLAAGQSPVLHFSCHGHQDYLALEDGWSAMQPLYPNELRDFVTTGRQHVKLVVVSACHSRPSGQAFVDAGIKHVVCCKTEHQVRDSAARVFTKALYRALACGRRLKEAFDIACKTVRLAPTVKDAGLEADKFLLLPEKEENDAYHDVHVFYQTDAPRMRLLSFVAEPRFQINIPAPPSLFVGRELTMFRMLECVRDARVVQLCGSRGIGKCSLAKAASAYIGERTRGGLIHQIFWFPPLSAASDDVSTSLRRLLESYSDGNQSSETQLGLVTAKLRHDHALIVIQVQALQLPAEKKSSLINLLVKELIRGTSAVKVLLTNQHFLCHGVVGDLLKFEVPPLGPVETVELFATLCPFVAQRRFSVVETPRQLVNVLLHKEGRSTGSTNMSRRCSEVFGWLGSGIPSLVEHVASTMTEGEYDELINFGMKSTKIESRSELEREISLLQKRQELAVMSKQYLEAQSLEDEITELVKRRRDLPCMGHLKAREKELTEAIDSAVSAKNFLRAHELNEEMLQLSRKMKIELESGIEGSDSLGGSFSSFDLDVCPVRLSGRWRHVGEVAPGGQKMSRDLTSLTRGVETRGKSDQGVPCTVDGAWLLGSWIRDSSRVAGANWTASSGDFDKISHEIVMKRHDLPLQHFTNEEPDRKWMHIWQYEIFATLEHGVSRVIGTKKLGISFNRYQEPPEHPFKWLEHVENPKILDVFFAIHLPPTTLDDLQDDSYNVDLLKTPRQVIETGKSPDVIDFRRIVRTVHVASRKDEIVNELVSSEIKVLFWLSEGDNELATYNSELTAGSVCSSFPNGKPPDVAVVCATFGARLIATRLQKIGINNVMWLSADPFCDSFSRLLSTVLLPVSSSLLSGKLISGAYENFKIKAKNLFPQGRVGCFLEGVTHLQCDSEEDHISSEAPIVFQKLSWGSLKHWSQLSELQRLKVDLADKPLIEETVAFVLRHAGKENSRRFHLIPHTYARERKSTWDRTRGIAMRVCSEIARDHRFAIDAGVYRIASVADSEKVNEMLEGMFGRSLIWIDFANAESVPFDSTSAFRAWVNRLNENATVILLFTSDSTCFPLVQDILRGSRFLGDIGELEAATGLEITEARVNGLLSLVPYKDEDGRTCSLLEKMDNVSLLHDALARIMYGETEAPRVPRHKGKSTNHIYRDDDGSIKIRVSVSNLIELKRLLDLVYVGKGAASLAKVCAVDEEKVKFDCSAFATCYEKTILQLETLTSHQYERLMSCKDLRRVRIEGGAGTGKTFVALNSTLDFLSDEAKRSENVLYACRNSSLAYHFAKWLCYRYQHEGSTNELLKRLYFLTVDDEAPTHFRCYRGELSGVSAAQGQSLSFGKIVVDEAHDIFRDAQDSAGTRLRDRLRDALRSNSDSEVMLLSDISQASVSRAEITYPDDSREPVLLHEVCRSSKRVIGGAMSYQVSNRDLIRFSHESDGLCLRSVLFTDQQSSKERYKAYAEKILDAIKDIRSSHANLELHDRLAVICPDENFRRSLCDGPCGLTELLESQKDVLGSLLVPKTALEASRVLNLDSASVKESWIVVDSVSGMCGLERLIVFGVGLDEPIGDGSLRLRLVRSRIYRTFTRAHLMYYLINERVRGGWFEWIEHQEQQDAEFSFEAAVKLSNNAATDLATNVTRRNSLEAVRSKGSRALTSKRKNRETKFSNDRGSSNASGVNVVSTSDRESLEGGDIAAKQRAKLVNLGIWDTSGNERGLPSQASTEVCSFVPVATQKSEEISSKSTRESFNPDGIKSNAAAKLYPHMVKHLQRSFYTCFKTNGKISTKRLIACFSDPRAASLSRKMTTKAGIVIPPPPETFYVNDNDSDLKWLDVLEIGPGLSPCVNNSCKKLLLGISKVPGKISTLDFFEVLCLQPSLRGIDAEKVRALIRVEENVERRQARESYRGILNNIKSFSEGDVSDSRTPRRGFRKVWSSEDGKRRSSERERNLAVQFLMGNTAQRKSDGGFEWQLFVHLQERNVNRVMMQLPPPFRRRQIRLAFGSDGVFRSLSYNSFVPFVIQVDIYFANGHKIHVKHELDFANGGNQKICTVQRPSFK